VPYSVVVYGYQVDSHGFAVKFLLVNIEIRQLYYLIDFAFVTAKFGLAERAFYAVELHFDKNYRSVRLVYGDDVDFSHFAEMNVFLNDLIAVRQKKIRRFPLAARADFTGVHFFKPFPWNKYT
jgi:hypothetical protein